MRFLTGVLLGVAIAQAPSWRDTEPAAVVTRSYVIGSCTLSGAAHELDEGYLTCGAIQVLLPSESIAAIRMRELVGKRIELVVREVR